MWNIREKEDKQEGGKEGVLGGNKGWLKGKM